MEAHAGHNGDSLCFGPGDAGLPTADPTARPAPARHLTWPVSAAGKAVGVARPYLNPPARPDSLTEPSQTEPSQAHTVTGSPSCS